ncbi:hypothetical protein Bca4012_049980 [Brassica carinata]
MFIEINISTCVFLPRSGGGLRTGASCSWDLEKICNWFAVKGPVRSSSAKLSLLCLEMVVTKEELIDYALAVNSDGRYLTTRGVDRHVHKVQFVSAFMIMCLQAFTGHKNTVFSLCFRHRTAELYSGSFDRSVKACTYGWER